VVLVGWYPRHRHQVDATARRRLVLDGFVTVPGMLHVEEQELRSRRFYDLRQAGYQELPAETAEDGLAGEELLLYRVVAHCTCLVASLERAEVRGPRADKNDEAQANGYTRHHEFPGFRCSYSTLVPEVSCYA